MRIIPIVKEAPPINAMFVINSPCSTKIWIARENTGGNADLDSNLVEVVEAQNAPARNRINLNLFKKFKSNFEIYARFENIFNDVQPLYGYWPEISHYFGIKYKF